MLKTGIGAKQKWVTLGALSNPDVILYSGGSLPCYANRQLQWLTGPLRLC